MPLYEYKCELCGAVKEEFVATFALSKSPASQPECDKCKELMAKLEISISYVRRDYSDVSNFGDPRYAEARAKQCGVMT